MDGDHVAVHELHLGTRGLRVVHELEHRPHDRHGPHRVEGGLDQPSLHAGDLRGDAPARHRIDGTPSERRLQEAERRGPGGAEHPAHLSRRNPAAEVAQRGLGVPRGGREVADPEVSLGEPALDHAEPEVAAVGVDSRVGIEQRAQRSPARPWAPIGLLGLLRGPQLEGAAEVLDRLLARATLQGEDARPGRRTWPPSPARPPIANGTPAPGFTPDAWRARARSPSATVRCSVPTRAGRQILEQLLAQLVVREPPALLAHHEDRAARAAVGGPPSMASRGWTRAAGRRRSRAR